MSRIGDSLDNQWWNDMYKRYGHTDPSNRVRGQWATDALSMPIVIDSNPEISIRLKAHHNGSVDTYTVGGVSSNAARHQQQIATCTQNTGAPYICARKYLGRDVEFAGSTNFESLGF